jgi:hypothetical protein
VLLSNRRFRVHPSYPFNHNQNAKRCHRIIRIYRLFLSQLWPWELNYIRPIHRRNVSRINFASAKCGAQHNKSSTSPANLILLIGFKTEMF